MCTKKTFCLWVLVLCVLLTLPGCAVVRYLVSGDWNGNADLVVVSQHPDPIETIALEREDGGRVLADGRGFALLERGESYGLILDDEEEDCTITLFGMGGQELGSARIRFAGTRLYLTLWEDGVMTVSEEDG